MTETVTITKAEYESMLADKERLDLLESELVEIIYLDCGTLCLRSTINEAVFPAFNARRGIDELKKKIESSTKENEKGWISVKDRLPSEREDILICTNRGKIKIAWRDDVFFMSLLTYHLSSVTHWQPLPLPPKV
ncbi:TPA: DUF551 domain-containing protein [Pasteurella multocida]